MNQELEGIKESVAYIHQGYSIIRSYHFWHARGSSECKFSSCYGVSGLSLEVFLVKINLSVLPCEMVYPWFDGSEIICLELQLQDTFSNVILEVLRKL